MAGLVFDTCCGCINLRTGCLIIGYMQLVGEIIASIMLLIALTVSSVAAGSGGPEGDEDVKTLGIVLLIVCGILLVFIALALAFTITLLVGIHQNRRGHVKAYLVFAVIFTVIGVILFFASFAGNTVTIQSVITNIINLLLNIYFLLVVRSYFVKMGENKGPTVYSTA